MALVPDREAGRAVCAGPPLDFSFKELRASVQIETEEPRSGVKRSIAPAKEEGGQEAGCVGSGHEEKCECRYVSYQSHTPFS
eukprot:s344_g29.t1